MSFLRLASPGQPTKLIDEGPNTARVHSRGSLGVYGALVVAESERTRNLRIQRDTMRAARTAGKASTVCGLPLAGTFCGRHPGHNSQCRSRRSMDVDNARKAVRA